MGTLVRRTIKNKSENNEQKWKEGGPFHSDDSGRGDDKVAK
jgi:hypothetical protein